MITEAFDNQSPAIINPQTREDVSRVDACILTFSHVIETFVLENYDYKQIASFSFATGNTPILPQLLHQLEKKRWNIS